MEQWTQWIKQQFQIPPEEETPDISHISEEQWGGNTKKSYKNNKKTTQINQNTPPEEASQGTIRIDPDLEEIRANSQLRTTIHQHPKIRKWVTSEYTEKELTKAISKLKNKKAHGIDGIPGEVYKYLEQWLQKPLLSIFRKIQQGDPLPPDWLNGAIAHIYKNKGGEHECKNYRPICLTQIIYKIRPILIATRIAEIIHLLTITNQYGYKKGLSTIYDIYKIEQYIQEGETDAQILLMDLSRAFDTINRTQLWTALYKKELPLGTIIQIREGRKNTKLCAEHQGEYGKLRKNNVGVFRGSEISALMFVIYLDDMMEDCEALNHQARLATRKTIQRDPQTGTEALLQHIQTNNDKETTEQLKTIHRKNKKSTQNRKRKCQMHHDSPPDSEKLTIHNEKCAKNPEEKQKPTTTNTSMYKEDYAIYADDANLFLHKEETKQTITRLTNYSLITKTRKCKYNEKSKTTNKENKNTTGATAPFQ